MPSRARDYNIALQPILIGQSRLVVLVGLFAFLTYFFQMR